MLVAEDHHGNRHLVCKLLELEGFARVDAVVNGLATAAGDQYEAYDLEILIPPGMRVRLNGLELEDGRVALSWRAAPAGWRIAAAAGAIVVVMLATGFSGVSPSAHRSC